MYVFVITHTLALPLMKGLALTTQMIVAQLSQEHERQGNRHGVALLDAMDAAFRLDDTRYVDEPLRCTWVPH